MKKTETKKNIFTRGTTLISKEHGTEVLVTNGPSPIKGEFWGVITKSTDPNAIGVHNHFSKDKFNLLTK